MKVSSSSPELVGVVAVVAAAAAVRSVAAAPFDYRNSLKLLWNDEFNQDDARPRGKFWNFDDEMGPSGVGTGELQTYTDDINTIKEKSGRLQITASRGDDGTFVSAGINSQDKVAVKYGTIVARIKAPNVARGLWPGFFTMGNVWGLGENDTTWPRSGSIDIVEFGQGLGVSSGLGNNRVVSATHWEHNETNAQYARWFDSNVAINETFNIYQLDWTNETITTYFNDAEIIKMDIRPEVCTDCEEFHRQHFLVLNMAVGGAFTGRDCDSTIQMECIAPSPEEITAPLPAVYEIDWVRIYDNGLGQTLMTCPGYYKPSSMPVRTPRRAPAAAPVEPPAEPPVARTSGPTAEPTESEAAATATSEPSKAPSTPGPTTAPVTSGPTRAPVTSGPTTAPNPAPTTAAPVTPAPVTPAPVTGSPTVAPVVPPSGAPSVAPVKAPTTAGPTFAPTALVVDTPEPTISYDDTMAPTSTDAQVVGTVEPTEELVAPPLAAPSCTCPPVIQPPTETRAPTVEEGLGVVGGGSGDGPGPGNDDDEEGSGSGDGTGSKDGKGSGDSPSSGDAENLDREDVSGIPDSDSSAMQVQASSAAPTMVLTSTSLTAMASVVVAMMMLLAIA